MSDLHEVRDPEGPKTEAGRARIAEAQRRRWAAYREAGTSVIDDAGDEATDD
jgi:hypothetical protein